MLIYICWNSKFHKAASLLLVHKGSNTGQESKVGYYIFLLTSDEISENTKQEFIHNDIFYVNNYSVIPTSFSCIKKSQPPQNST